MNTRLLHKVQKAILAEPRQFNMDTWFSYFDCEGKPPPGCGTAACIGGWAIALSKNLTPRVLGLTVGQADRLFVKYLWPTAYRTRRAERTAKQYARNAAKRIDHFIKTEGEE